MEIIYIDHATYCEHYFYKFLKNHLKVKIFYKILYHFHIIALSRYYYCWKWVAWKIINILKFIEKFCFISHIINVLDVLVLVNEKLIKSYKNIVILTVYRFLRNRIFVFMVRQKLMNIFIMKKRSHTICTKIIQ